MCSSISNDLVSSSECEFQWEWEWECECVSIAQFFLFVWLKQLPWKTPIWIPFLLQLLQPLRPFCSLVKSFDRAGAITIGVVYEIFLSLTRSHCSQDTTFKIRNDVMIFFLVIPWKTIPGNILGVVQQNKHPTRENRFVQQLANLEYGIGTDIHNNTSLWLNCRITLRDVRRSCMPFECIPSWDGIRTGDDEFFEEFYDFQKAFRFEAWDAC